eukprot:NODE_17640_length_933_cov_3.771712.p3 GENE.NODE_17640_length_933_cov_3.771712~~NODE_17640_length_933_cov_3.771712.p3  ORF type:complete len:125 (+),score=16.96 NODE_17640_length_933_cov_3.771712:99-473(+)
MDLTVWLAKISTSFAWEGDHAYLMDLTVWLAKISTYVSGNTEQMHWRETTAVTQHILLRYSTQEPRETPTKKACSKKRAHGAFHCRRRRAVGRGHGTTAPTRASATSRHWCVLAPHRTRRQGST